MDFQIATLTKNTLSWIMKQILCDDVTGVQACSFSKLQMTQIYLSLLHTKRFKCFRELKLKNISASSEFFVNCEKLCRLSMYDQKKHNSCGQRTKGYAKMVIGLFLFVCRPGGTALVNQPTLVNPSALIVGCLGKSAQHSVQKCMQL